MRLQVAKQAASVTVNALGAGDGVATVTIAADVDHVWAIDTVYFSYSAAPTNGLLTIAINGATRFQHHITAGGVGFISFRSADDEGLYGVKNQAVVITLAASAGATGNLTVKYR